MQGQYVLQIPGTRPGVLIDARHENVPYARPPAHEQAWPRAWPRPNDSRLGESLTLVLTLAMAPTLALSLPR